MKIGIIFAMEEEFDSMVQTLNITFILEEKANFTIQIANYATHQLIFILCGIGKVNAAIHTQYLIDTYEPDCIINVGVAGNLSPELDFGDVVIATDLVQHDVNVTSFGIPLGQIPRMDTFAFPVSSNLLTIATTIQSNDFKIVTGRIATGDQFIDNKKIAEFIHTEFKALACEMEGGAVAHTCYVNQIPFIIIRALSDMAGRTDTAIHSFEQLKYMTAARSSFVVKNLLELLCHLNE